MKPTTRTTTCQHCEQSHLFWKGLDDDENPIWTCSLCGHETEREVRTSAKRQELEAILAEFGIK